MFCQEAPSETGEQSGPGVFADDNPGRRGGVGGRRVLIRFYGGHQNVKFQGDSDAGRRDLSSSWPEKANSEGQREGEGTYRLQWGGLSRRASRARSSASRAADRPKIEGPPTPQNRSKTRTTRLPQPHYCVEKSYKWIFRPLDAPQGGLKGGGGGRFRRLIRFPLVAVRIYLGEHTKSKAQAQNGWASQRSIGQHFRGACIYVPIRLYTHARKSYYSTPQSGFILATMASSHVRDSSQPEAKTSV